MKRFPTGALLVGLSRTGALFAVVLVIGMLPWLSGQSPEYTVLRARYADLEATPESLAMVRAELGLDRGPVAVFIDWFSGVLTGDLGQSWISNSPVLPGTLAALGVSVTLMICAGALAVVIAILFALPSLLRSSKGAHRRGSGVLATTATSLPEFLLASLLLVIGAVWLGWFPPSGWLGLHYAVLPSLAMGIPSGGLMGKLLADAISSAGEEQWVSAWLSAGFTRRQIAVGLLRRALPTISSQAALVVIGVTGGAVAVERVFAIPGIGRSTLGAATAQDIPTLQAGVLALLLLAIAAGITAAMVRRALLGPAGRLEVVPVAFVPPVFRRRDLAVPSTAALLLTVITAAGILRDPFAAVHPRLAPPSWLLPFGADASGRDLLARVGHGTLSTIGTALIVVLISLIVGLLIGSLPRLGTGPLEIANAAPPVIAGIIVAAISGASLGGAALAVALVSWAPLAAHTSALTLQARSLPFVSVLPILGVGRIRTLVRHILPHIIGTLVQHAMLRLPGVALALAALGFLGLGANPPSPDWGLVLAEGMAYVERAPWTVLAPSLALILASILAVSASGLTLPPHLRRRKTKSETDQAP
ncbi:ABC transporter permease subunit [Arthrobacter sp. AET 35A]|uniref:ABC transporter permease subunit n=1 Tax=Arthrobacter sp. AET 35A TaxID=2292643 RepID=UPI001783ADBA|nr:ABC transporter permease subunit [Arthrobacter sp. AET 35A]MBE0011278.1 ABC transporter permease subunit [Arthrobacter sp. AET 35A]